MSDAIIDFRTPAAGFDQPIAMWLACHERVLRMINLLARLREHLASGGAIQSAGVTAASILRYFDEAAPRHHEDEEVDLFPRVVLGMPPAEREPIASVIGELRAQHAVLDGQWAALRPHLAAIAAGTPDTLDAAQVGRFVADYLQHVERENDVLAPAFRRAFGADELDAIGRSMAARRGVDWETPVARR